MKDAISSLEPIKALSQETLLKHTEKLARIGSWQYNFQTETGKWSDEAYYLLGYEPGEVSPTFKNFLSSVHPDDLEHVKKSHAEIQIKNLNSQKFKHRIIDNKTKEVRYLVTELIFERDSYGEPFQAIGFIQDITSAKLAEQKLIESQAQLLASQRIAHIGSWEVNLTEEIANDGIPVTWSPEVYRIFGLDPKNYSPTTKSVMAMVCPEDRAKLQNKYLTAIETGKSYRCEYRIIRSDNTERIVQGRGQVLMDKISGKPLKVIGTTQDITERKEEELALLNSEANLRTIFDNTTSLYILVDRNLKILSFNKPALRTFYSTTGKTLEVGENALDYIADDRKERAGNMYKRVFDGEKFKVEDSFVLKDGTTIWYYMQLLPVFGDENKVLSMTIYLKDITSRKLAEIERSKISANLLQRNKALEEFSYIVSHSLRLPVANILGLVNNFNTLPQLDHEQRDIISALYISARKLDDVVLELNKTLEIRNGECENKQNVRLSEVLNNTKVALGYLIKKESAIIESDIPEQDELFTVKSYISSIFYNLILNSIKFRQPSLTPHITISATMHARKTVLTFCDNGLGIDLSKNSDGLFSMYKRFHSYENGKGMGLFMVKAQVESMGGKISVESEVHKGTIFTIELEQ